MITRETFPVLETWAAAFLPAWSAMVPPPVKTARTRRRSSVALGAAAPAWSSVRTTCSASQSRMSAAELTGDITGTWADIAAEVAPTLQKCAPSKVTCSLSVLSSRFVCRVGVNCSSEDVWTCGGQGGESGECISRYYLCDGVIDCEVENYCQC